ncbi:hypothetical protein [Phytohabitans aurantiacus]|uniref:SMODS-associated and fused to various effectors domain-containing protein n=1 Tax=Phytohabitans aurantiacus TaxID=3016789 RepID=A0ABQ5R2E5_9ACTN|nr:hypothetical protein [Phytohabitans aurantiacus]GLI00901.1 hypothetical protein Pa4123_61770 [Phytohabitans aurantiacus]
MTAPWAATTRWWRHVGGTLLVATANFAVATALAGTVALLGLVVEDSLPVTGQREFSTARVLLLGVALVALFAAVVWRGSVYRRTGTLFYVRLIDGALSDWHVALVRVASRRRMSLRSVTRWVDLPSSTRNGTIDLVNTCTEVAAALEAVVNSDRDDTAYTISPNMPWPAAVAIGAELPIVDSLRLLELRGRPDSSSDDVAEISFRLAPPTGDTALPGATTHLTTGSRVGLLLVFTSRGLYPHTVFDGMDVGEFYKLDPASLGITRHAGTDLTGAQLAALAQALPPAVAAIKQAARDRELVIAAALPKTLAMALGWGLAQGQCRFFAGTHLMHCVDNESGRCVPMRVHPAQPASSKND